MSDLSDLPVEHDHDTDDDLPIMEEDADVDLGSVVSSGDIEADPVDEIEQNTPLTFEPDDSED